MVKGWSDSALREYRSMGLQGVVEQASRHELVRLLMDGGLDRIAAARGQIMRGDAASKGASIGRAISIIECLRASLNTEDGGEIAANLESLYDYMQHQLTQANMTNDTMPLDEVEVLLERIRDGWMAAGDLVRSDIEQHADAAVESSAAP